VAVRAAELAEMTARALDAARSNLGEAADLTDTVDNRLRDVEYGVDQVSAQANKVRFAETDDEVELPLRTARHAAYEVQEDLQRAQRGIGEVRERLEQSARAIAAGRDFINELDELPGQRSEANDQLRYRLAAFDRAVHGAMAGTERTEWRLRTARENLEPLLNVPGAGDQERTAAVIREVGADATQAVEGARGGIRTLREDFDHTRSEAMNISRDSSELADALRAGMNPTAPSEQTAPAAPEDPRRAWSEGRDLSKGLNL
jgi:predicted  nucleic acid-binding Zn-ribbon protein